MLTSRTATLSMDIRKGTSRMVQYIQRLKDGTLVTPDDFAIRSGVPGLDVPTRTSTKFNDQQFYWLIHRIKLAGLKCNPQIILKLAGLTKGWYKATPKMVAEMTNDARRANHRQANRAKKRLVKPGLRKNMGPRIKKGFVIDTYQLEGARCLTSHQTSKKLKPVVSINQNNQANVRKIFGDQTNKIKLQ